MRGPRVSVLAPLISEKGSMLSESSNQVIFKVRPDANKIEIKQATELVFEVKVVKVNTTTVPGKIKRLGRFQGRRASWKKAIVTLAEDESIDLFGEA